MSAFSGQFVPVKIVTDGNPQWSKWAQKYPIDGRGIPRLYVVRADGEMLYGAVGSLPDEQLPRMLMATLKQSGRSFNNAEAELLETAVNEAQAAMDGGDILKASIALSSLNELGSLDELGSYASSALQAGELYQELQARIEANTEKSAVRLNESTLDGDTALPELLVLAEAEAAYKLFPSLRRQATAFTREFRTHPAYGETLPQAEALIRARSLRATANPRIRSRAVRAYSDVIRRFPQTAADELARAELQELDPDAQLPDVEMADGNVSETEMRTDNAAASAASEGFRKWTARSGKFSTTAKYIQQKGGKVQLMKNDGSTIVVEIAVLSDEDQEFLRKQRVAEAD